MGDLIKKAHTTGMRTQSAPGQNYFGAQGSKAYTGIDWQARYKKNQAPAGGGRRGRGKRLGGDVRTPLSGDTV